MIHLSSWEKVKVKLSESEIRSLIREAVSQQYLNDLLDRAREQIISYIDNPAKGDKTFKTRLNKRLKQMNRKQLTDEEVQSIKRYFKDITVGVEQSCPTSGPCLGYFVASKKYIGLLSSFLEGATEDNIFNVIYHELAHGLDAVFQMITIDKDDDLRHKREYRQTLGMTQAAEVISQELTKFLEDRKDTGEMSRMFKKEIQDMQDAALLNNNNAWNEKVRKMFPRSKFTGRVNQLLTPSVSVRKVLKEPDHVYTAIQQLRRYFPGKKLSEICSLPESSLLKLNFWTQMFLVSFKCDTASNNAYEVIATKPTDNTAQTKTV